jgi:hypothetical protein
VGIGVGMGGLLFLTRIIYLVRGEKASLPILRPQRS